MFIDIVAEFIPQHAKHKHEIYAFINHFMAYTV